MVSYLDCSIIVCTICKRAEFGYFQMGMHIARHHSGRNMSSKYLIEYPQKIKGS